MRIPTTPLAGLLLCSAVSACGAAPSSDEAPANDAPVDDAPGDGSSVPCDGTVSGAATATLTECEVIILSWDDGERTLSSFGFDVRGGESDAFTSIGVIYSFDGAPAPGRYAVGDVVGGGIASMRGGVAYIADHEGEPGPDDAGEFTLVVEEVVERERDGFETQWSVSGSVQVTFVLRDEPPLRVDAAF